MSHDQNAGDDSFEAFQELLLQLDEDREALLELASLVKQEFPPLLNALRDAGMRGDLTLLFATAHTVKGMLSSVAFKDAAALAADLESMARRGATEGIAETISRIERQTADSLIELERFCQVGT